MYHGDRSRKKTLVEYGFRLPSALDNRPLSFAEWEGIVGQVVYVSATPGPYEMKKAGGRVIEQVIRPTGLMDPPILVRPAKGQVDDLLNEVRKRAERGERVLVTTLTKKTAENLTDYFAGLGVRVRYLHSDIDTLERMEILRELRLGSFDVLVGINLREGLDLPEVSLVAILDADKEGFLRSARSLIQTAGRAARNVGGEVIFYGDTVTGSMRTAMDETERRRAIQAAYNAANGITPQTIRKGIPESLRAISEADYVTVSVPEEAGVAEARERYVPADEIPALIRSLSKEMRKAAQNLDFERASILRDRIRELRGQELALGVRGVDWLSGHEGSSQHSAISGQLRAPS